MPKGIHNGKRGRKQKLDYPITEWVDLYLSGKTINHISKIVKVNKNKVSRLIKTKIELRKPIKVIKVKSLVDKRRKQFNIIEWVGLYESGMSIEKISAFVKSSKETVSRELKAYGIKIYRGRGWGGERCGRQFDELLKTNTETGCIEWCGYLNNKGYGEYYDNGKRWLAHRYSYLKNKGDIGGLNVLHKCDNPKCVNPDHLFLGTQRDNVIDMIVKGRRVYNKKNIV